MARRATRRPTPLRRALSMVASTASWSKSIDHTGSKPRRRAAIDSTPDPHPASSRPPGATGRPASSSRQARVVPCWAVPKAMPGSISMSSSGGRGGSQGGRTSRRPATSTGRWNSSIARRHASSWRWASTRARHAAVGQPRGERRRDRAPARAPRSRGRPRPPGRSPPCSRSPGCPRPATSARSATSAGAVTVSRISSGSAEGVLETVEEPLVLAVVALVQILGELRHGTGARPRSGRAAPAPPPPPAGRRGRAR